MRTHYRFAQLVLRFLFKILFKNRIINHHFIPGTGGVLLVSNHISYFDPPVLGVAVSPRELSYLAKKELFRNKLFGSLIASYNAIPVNRGHIDRTLLARLSELVNQGKMLLVFPEGTRSKTGELGRAKPGVGMLALQAHVTVVPAYLTGTKTPLAAIFRTSTIRIVFGRPISVAELDQFPLNEEGYRQCSRFFMERIQQLKESVA